MRNDHPPFILPKVARYARFTATALVHHCNPVTDTLCFTPDFAPLLVLFVCS